METKFVTIELDQEKLEQAQTVCAQVGLNIEVVLTMALTKVANEKSLSFLLNKSESNSQPTPSSIIAQEYPHYAPTISYTNSAIATKMTKSRAKNLLKSNESAHYIFASKNASTYNYWANFSFKLLDDSLGLILNDNINRKLYLFEIPAHAINQEQLIARADQSTIVDLQICYNDPTFTDNRSKYSFKNFLVKELNY